MRFWKAGLFVLFLLMVLCFCQLLSTPPKIRGNRGVTIEKKHLPAGQMFSGNPPVWVGAAESWNLMVKRNAAPADAVKVSKQFYNSVSIGDYYYYNMTPSN
jgi:hypothetical protein